VLLCSPFSGSLRHSSCYLLSPSSTVFIIISYRFFLVVTWRGERDVTRRPSRPLSFFSLPLTTFHHLRSFRSFAFARDLKGLGSLSPYLSSFFLFLFWVKAFSFKKRRGENIKIKGGKQCCSSRRRVVVVKGKEFHFPPRCRILPVLSCFSRHDWT
jgi:hypothetical protein